MTTDAPIFTALPVVALLTIGLGAHPADAGMHEQLLATRVHVRSRLGDLYRWSATELRLPELAGLVHRQHGHGRN